MSTAKPAVPTVYVQCVDRKNKVNACITLYYTTPEQVVEQLRDIAGKGVPESKQSTPAPA